MIEKAQLSADDFRIEEDALIDFQFAIIDAMKAKGISQSDLANLLHVSRSRVSQLLSSEANPTLKLVGRALQVLDLKADYVSKENQAPVHQEDTKVARARSRSRGLHAMSQQIAEVEKAWGVSWDRYANENYAELKKAA